MMPSNTNTTDSLRRIFYEGFVARDIAEPLASFDVTVDVSTLRQFMTARPLSIVGIRIDGIITGYVDQQVLDERPISEQMQAMDAAKIVSTTTPLRDVVLGLTTEPFLFVSTLGQAAGVIMRSDFEKPPMRMWLFGAVTLLEISVTRIIEDFYTGESWVDHVSEARLAKARELQRERNRRNLAVRLIDCLQLGDKGQLLARNTDLREKYWNRSRRQIEKSVKEMESLRNNLAHSQALVNENWDVIVRISETLDRYLEIPSDLVSPSSLNPRSDDGRVDDATC